MSKANLILTISLFLVYQINLFAQVDLSAHYDFDDCQVTDNTGNFMDGQILGSMDCDCGVGDNSSAFYFNGSGDTIQLDGELKSFFNDDFSLSFYLWMDNVSIISSIMSIQGECQTARDSAFFIRYFPVTKEVVIEMSKNFGEIITLRSKLPVNNCWNHILFTKEGQDYTLYLNGLFVEKINFISTVVLGQDFPFLIGASPCVGANEEFFRGKIDELKFINRALKSEEEILGIQDYPDKILTQDTTIFEGSSFTIKTSTSCAPSLEWSPSIGLSDSFSPSPEANPTETTTYTLEYDHGTCISKDELVVSVLSEDEIRCGNILLPNAFTPNNDGINDKFGISNSFIIESLQRFEIYDRWGLKLFESFNKGDKWNGQYKGNAMPPSVYVYKLEYTCLGQSYSRTGNFNIIK